MNDYQTRKGHQNRIRELEIQIAQLRDVETRLLNTQRNLKDAERLAKLGHWELDIPNNRLCWSDEIYRLFEIDPKKFGATYEAFLDTIHPQDREMVHNAYTRSVKNRTPYSINHRLQMADGRIKYVNERCFTYYDEAGRPARSLGTVHDLTERVAQEKEKVRVEKLEATSTLAGGIAHDFNNLLVAILGNLELVEEMVRSEEELHGLIEEARKGALRARDISRQLLTFAKGGDPVREPTDFCELVRDSASFFLSGTSISIEYLFESDLWSADIDSGQVGQVLQNLILNAAQAMPDGGAVSIRCANREITVNDDIAVPSGSYIEVEIVDDGPGMDEDGVKRAFDPYFSTKENGSGLGLATARSIIQRHGGQISLQSRLGEGTVFNIFLPARKTVESPREIPISRSLGPLRILVVDDDSQVGNLTVRMARRFGDTAEFAMNSGDAIERFRRSLESGKPYDLVILDLTMPGDKGGEWILDKMKEIDSDVRALVSSGYSENGVMVEHTKRGFVGILKKPFTIREMENELNRHRN